MLHPVGGKKNKLLFAANPMIATVAATAMTVYPCEHDKRYLYFKKH
jgi:hypothetical protein